jgi:hypothetical protein
VAVLSRAKVSLMTLSVSRLCPSYRHHRLLLHSSSSYAPLIGSGIRYSTMLGSLQLYEKLEAAMRTLGRRNKNGLHAAITCESDELECFNAVCGLVSRSCCQFFADSQAELCMFTDASAVGWSIIVTQVREWKPDFPVHAQAHQLIVCKGGSSKAVRRIGPSLRKRRSRL